MNEKANLAYKDLPQENIYAHTKKLRFIIEQIERFIEEHGEPITLLDFGCGNGLAVAQFLNREGILYYGVDFHHDSVEYATSHFASEKASFSDRVPLDVVFDVIVYADVIEHLEDPVANLRSHRKQLHDHGIIIGSVPNGFGPFENEKRIDNWLGLSRLVQRVADLKNARLPAKHERINDIPYNLESGHVQFFTKRSLAKVLGDSGYAISEFQNGSFIGAPLSGTLLRGDKFARFNARLADFVPWWAASTWYFTARKGAQI